MPASNAGRLKSKKTATDENVGMLKKYAITLEKEVDDLKHQVSHVHARLDHAIFANKAKSEEIDRLSHNLKHLQDSMAEYRKVSEEIVDKLKTENVELLGVIKSYSDRNHALDDQNAHLSHQLKVAQESAAATFAENEKQAQQLIKMGELVDHLDKYRMVALNLIAGSVAGLCRIDAEGQDLIANLLVDDTGPNGIRKVK